MKKKISELLEKFDSSGFYQQEIKALSEEQQTQFEKIVERLEAAGSKEPLSWALSEVEEGIPQYARFVFLKNIFDIINDSDENLALADDVDEEYSEDIFAVSEKLKAVVGEDGLTNFLRSYTKGVMWQVLNLIDGSYATETVWALRESSGSHRNIDGLHESFNEFEEEL